MRDLGSMGESAFSLWCHSVGLTVNGSKIDKTGWDFLVEFPLSPPKKLPLDMSPAPLECKIQVKATDQKIKKVQITLSNLHRLVKAPYPTFICFIEFNGKNEAQAAYLVHLDEEMIKKTLKKIRALEVKGIEMKLNKRKTTIHYTDKEKLQDTSGESLKKAIEQYIPGGIEEYIRNKNKLLKTLGFEKSAGHFKIAVSGSDPIKDFVDLTLGIRTELEIDKFTGYRSRFDIVSPTPFIEAEKGTLAVVEIKPNTKAVLTFKENKFSPGISFSTDIYSSQLNNVVPDNYKKIRAKGKFFEILFHPSNKDATYSFNLTSKTDSSLKEVRDMLKLLTLMKTSPKTLELEIKPDNHSPLRAEIKC